MEEIQERFISKHHSLVTLDSIDDVFKPEDFCGEVADDTKSTITLTEISDNLAKKIIGYSALAGVNLLISTAELGRGGFFYSATANVLIACIVGYQIFSAERQVREFNNDPASYALQYYGKSLASEK